MRHAEIDDAILSIITRLEVGRNHEPVIARDHWGQRACALAAALD
jgi:hypothetical protein